MSFERNKDSLETLNIGKDRIKEESLLTLKEFIEEERKAFKKRIRKRINEFHKRRRSI